MNDGADESTASLCANNAVSDVDYRLIGLSPQYWSHTPLLIGDLVGLPLINGVDCFVAPPPSQIKQGGCDTSCDDPKAGKVVNLSGENILEGLEDERWRIIPLSRVMLRGIATAVDHRSNGCTLIVLDDGTGHMDCLYWDNSRGGDSAYNLPALLPEHEQSAGIAVGDSLEVMGKIKALTAGKIASEGCKLMEGSSVALEVRIGCVREIHATSVCTIGKGRSKMSNEWNGEMVHWLRCMDFSRKVSRGHVRNGRDVLPLLGPAISSSILGSSGSHFVESGKARGGGGVLHRKCCGTPRRFRKALFYCHCEATLEPLDPTFSFRDALLHRLLDMEGRLQCVLDSAYPTVAEDCMDLLGLDSSDSTPPPLLFAFSSIYNDEALMSEARDAVASLGSPEGNAPRLVRRTFAAMADDGILSLYDREKDLYLLVSRSRVIEPFLLGSKGAMSTPGPFFIRSVPKRRMAEIVDWMQSEDSGS